MVVTKSYIETMYSKGSYIESLFFFLFQWLKNYIDFSVLIVVKGITLLYFEIVKDILIWVILLEND